MESRRRAIDILTLLIMGTVSDRSSKDDLVAHIQCQVCELMVSEAHGYVERHALTSEDDVGDLVDHLCVVKRKEGRWVSSIDLVDSGDSLTVTRQSDVGVCRRECHVGYTACTRSLKGKEDTLADMLRAREPLSSMKASLCKASCKKKRARPQIWENEVFEKRDAAVVAQEDALPPGMQSYNANDILSMTESDQAAWFADQEHKKMLRDLREAEM